MKRVVLYTIFSIAAAMVVLYAAVDPQSTPLFPRCAFLDSTGYPCPGCGSQRAIHSLLNLDLLTAFGYNPLVVMGIPTIGLLLYNDAKPKRHPWLSGILSSRLFSWGVVIVVILWWVYQIYRW